MSDKNPTNENPFKGWRSDETPSFELAPLKVDFPASVTEDELSALQSASIGNYHRATLAMEHSVGDVALLYTHKDGDPKSKEKGPLLDFASTLSERYLDLMKASIAWDMAKGIPMIPVSAGQLKTIGFSSSDIINMQKSCQTLMDLTNKILLHCGGDIVEYNNIIGNLINSKSRDAKLKEREKIVKENKPGDVFLLACIDEYLAIPQHKMIDRAYNGLHHFNRLSFQEIDLLLQSVARMQIETKAARAAPEDEKSLEDERRLRLLMEIRHRMAGDATVQQRSLGSLGSNPLAYLNAVTEGEPKNFEAEFREKMYFVYMCGFLANDIINDNEKIEFINKWLKDNKKNWEINSDFIEALKNRSPEMPALYKYGANAALNGPLRKPKTQEEIEAYTKANLNPTIQEVLQGTADLNTFLRSTLSERELMNQIGEWVVDPNNEYTGEKRLNFIPGAGFFNLETTPENITANTAARQYLETVNALEIPVVAGISGTLDRSTTMAGVVGLGISSDLKQREKDLERIRLAYIAFMVPGHDHSVHEIMQSSKTFGLKYQPGPGYEKYIYPEGGEAFIQKLKEAQYARGFSELPQAYLSREYIENQLAEIRLRASAKSKARTSNEAKESTEARASMEARAEARTEETQLELEEKSGKESKVLESPGPKPVLFTELHQMWEARTQKKTTPVKKGDKPKRNPS